MQQHVYLLQGGKEAKRAGVTRVNKSCAIFSSFFSLFFFLFSFFLKLAVLMVNFWGGHGLTSGIWRLEERKEQLSRGMRLRSRVECAHARSWHTLSSSSLARCERVIQNHRGRLRQRAVRDIPFAKRANFAPAVGVLAILIWALSAQ